MKLTANLAGGVALGVLVAAGLSAPAEAATRRPAPSAADTELLQELRELRAQVQALQARLDAQDAARPAAQAEVQAAQAQAQAAQADVVAAKAQIGDLTTQLQTAQAAIAAIPAPPATTMTWDGATRFTGNGNTFKFRGRILIDAAAFDIDRQGTVNDLSGRQIRGRQAFLGVEGNIGSKFGYKVEGGAVNGGAWAWDDAYFEYKVTRQDSIFIGNIKAAGLENITSSRFTSFLDRGPYDNLAQYSYLLAVQWQHVGSNWTFTAAAQGDSINSADVAAATGSSNNNERIGYTARATWFPINDAHRTLHLGAWTRYRKHGDDGLFTYAAGYNSPLRPVTLTTTGGVGDTDLTMGWEGAFVWDSFSLQTEGARIHVNRLAGQPDFDINTGFVFGSWFLTGERRQYGTKGEFTRPRVINPVDKNGWGALEVLARFDWADLTDAKAANGIGLPNAGTYKGYTLAATWYPINYVHFMANFTHGIINNPGLVNDAKTNVFQVRAQLDW
jgi:phosphate-selective porin OprO/OprP